MNKNNEMFADFVCEHINDLIEKNASDGVYFLENENCNDYINNSLKEAILSEAESEELTDELAESLLIAQDIASIYVESLIEAVNEDDDDSEEDEDDKDDDSEEDDEELDETTATKHKITKIQSIIDARKRKTDAKWKQSRKRTEMKRAARGEVALNKKLSRSIKKSYNQGFGKRWESDEEDEMIGPDKEAKKKEAAAKLAKKTEVCKESVKESIQEAFKDSPVFGSLNESESISLKETFEKLVLEAIDKQSEMVSEALVEEMDTYVNEELIPSLEESVEAYVEQEVVPSINEDVEKYIDYVASEVVESLNEQKLIVKSKKSLQAEAFTEKLLELIESELNIIPEQEDIIDVLESKLLEATNKVDAERLKKIEYRKEIEEAEKAIFLLKEFNKNAISEARQEQIMEELNECDSFIDFKSKAEELIKESDDPQEKDIADNQMNESKNVQEFSYIDKAMQILKNRV